MKQLHIIIGFTHTDRRADYVPAQDGYRPGATQTPLTIGPVQVVSLGGQLVTQDTRLTVEQVEMIAETCYSAMNRPHTAPGRLEQDIKTAIETALQAWKDTDNPAIDNVHIMSVGDTVTVEDITVACMGQGWEQVTTPIPPASATICATPDAR